MLKKYDQYFKEFILARTDEIVAEILLSNQRYRELNDEICQVQHELAANLAPQLQSLLDRYENAEAEHDGVISTAMYRQGLLDGVKLAKLINHHGLVPKLLE
jgi:hypothetical protein